MVALQRRIKSHPWLADTLLAIMRMQLSRGGVARSMHANAVGPGDADWLARHPETIDRITLALKEAMRVTSRGTSDEIRHGGALEPNMDPPVTPPITVWLGEEDAYTRPMDMEQWLGPHLSELRILPAIGNYMIAKHWDAALQSLASANHASETSCSALGEDPRPIS